MLPFPNINQEGQRKIAVQAQEEQFNDIQPFEVIDDSVYTASLDSYADIDLNGKRISKIRFYGLKTINPEILLPKINSQQGSLYNDDILQKDLHFLFFLL